MAVSLTNYTGNAGLGVGGTTVQVAPTNPNLDIINNSIRDVMLLDNQRNVQLFQQKIRDRDALTEMIMKNQVSSGDILPEYRKHFDDAERQAEKAFMDWGGNFNDKEGFRKYSAAAQDLRDISAHAQAKTIGMRQLEKEKSQQALPRKQQEYESWIQREKQKPFWEQVTPYQQLHDFAIDDILAGVKTFSREAQDPGNPSDPAFKVTESYIDFDDILRFKRNQYVNDQDAADSIDQMFDKLQRLAPHQLVPTLDAMDAQIERYNQERQLSPGDRGYVDKINRVSVNGQTLIQDPKPEFAAKYALANQGQFVSRTPKFNKDLAKYGLDKERLALQARKLGIDAAKAGAYIRNLNAKTKKFLEQEQAAGTNVAKQFEDFVNAMEPRGLPIGIRGQQPTEVLDIIYTDRLPQSYQFINGPIVSLDSKGKPTNKITVGRLEPFIATTGQRRPYYIPRYVNSQTGDQLSRDSDFIKDTYKTWRDDGYRGTVDDMVKTLIKNGAIELTLQGRNGAANYSSMYQSAKTLNAIGTSKGDENIVNAPDEIPEEMPEPEE